MRFSTGPAAIHALSAANEEKRILVASDRWLAELVDGRVSRRLEPQMGLINSIASSPSGRLWAMSGADKAILVENGKPVGSFPLHGFGHVHVSEAANRAIGWAGKHVSVATYRGTLLAEIEFAQDVRFVACQDDGKLVAAMRYAILLDTCASPQTASTHSGARPE